ncbi:MAG: cupin domain-containing protein [Nonlabens sp.]
MNRKINLKEKLKLFSDLWTPKIVAELNGQHVKLAKLKGEFPWHKHDDEDELFYVIKGTLQMELPDQTIELHPGEFFVVPAGVKHKPIAAQEVHVLLFEPAQIKHTGDVTHELTQEHLDWI